MTQYICNIDWVAVSALATFVMVIVTWLSLRQVKRQWDEERRPRLNFSVIDSQVWYALKITNLGKQNAYNIKLKFNDEFISSLEASTREAFLRLQSRPFAIEAETSKYYMICSCKDWDKIHEIITISGRYCDRYRIQETVYVGEYVTNGMVVDDNLTTYLYYIKKGLIVQNDQYFPIQKSLDIIAKKISKKREPDDIR